MSSVDVINNVFRVEFKTDMTIMEYIRNLREHSDYRIYDKIHIIGEWIKQYNTEDKIFIKLWMKAILHTSHIAGCNPSIVIGWLSKVINEPFEDNHKAIETYILFYFAFFKTIEVTNHSMKIAKLISNLKEMDNLMLRFKLEEAECIKKSLYIYNQKQNNPIIKVWIKYDNDHLTTFSDDYKWIVYGNYSIKETDILGYGISSTIIWARKDAQKFINELIGVSKDCDIIYYIEK